MCFSALLLSLVALHTWCFALLSHIVISSYYFPLLIVSCFDFVGLLFLTLHPLQKHLCKSWNGKLHIFLSKFRKNFTFHFVFLKKIFAWEVFSFFVYVLFTFIALLVFLNNLYNIHYEKIVHTYIGYTSKKFVFLKCS